MGNITENNPVKNNFCVDSPNAPLSSQEDGVYIVTLNES